MRQTIKFRFEIFIHKNRLWGALSDDDKAEYEALRKEFVATSASMLRDYEQNGSADRNVRSGSTSKKRTAREPQLRASLTTGIDFRQRAGIGQNKQNGLRSYEARFDFDRKC